MADKAHMLWEVVNMIRLSIDGSGLRKYDVDLTDCEWKDFCIALTELMHSNKREAKHGCTQIQVQDWNELCRPETGADEKCRKFGEPKGEHHGPALWCPRAVPVSAGEPRFSALGSTGQGNCPPMMRQADVPENKEF